MDPIADMDPRLLSLYPKNAVVATAITLWRHEKISYEEALILCIVNLAKENEHLTGVVTKMLEQVPNPLNIHLTDAQLQKLREEYNA